MTHGFCPSPEAAWGQKERSQDFQRLERILNFFHVDLEAAVAATMNPDEALSFEPSVDVRATGAFTASPQKHAIKGVLQACAAY